MLNPSAYLNIYSKFKNSLNISFIYGFNHNNNSYFLSAQLMNITHNSKNVTKLIRISKNNNSSISFMELMLICKNSSEHITNNASDGYNDDKTEGKIYFRANAAYFGKVGSNQNKEFEINDWEEFFALYVVFEDKNMSTVCAYSIKKIESAFNEVNEKYFSNENNKGNLESLTPQ